MDRTHRDRAATFYLGDRGETPGADSGALLEQIRTYVAAWEGKRAHAGSLLLGRNVEGSCPPLFWVFQGQQEWINLAGRLGPSQPLYGLRSGHQVMDYTEANVQELATAYRREIEAAQPHGPVLLGGNCQGGLIALAIAQQFWRLHRPVALLALLEWAFPPQPYVGRVALLWGDASRDKNPYFRFRRPELLWERIFGAHTVDIIPGAHGQFFDGAGLAALADRLSVRMAEALRAPLLMLPGSLEGMARYRLLDVPTRADCGEEIALSVAVTNAGSVAFAATEHSGLRVANHWLSARGDVVHWLDAEAALPELAPGEETIVVVKVRAPSVAGRYTLQIDLVEEGVGWFSERGVAPLQHTILVVAGQSEAS